MEGRTREVDVVIVGAGPVGLSAAVALRQAGLAVAVVERDRGPITQSRAVWIHPRTVELWDGIGMAQRALSRGNLLERIEIHPYTRQLGTVWYDGGDRTAFPKGLILEQSVTQRLLLDRLAELGTTPLWGHTVTAVAQGDKDAFMETWLPVLHKDYIERFKDQVVDLGNEVVKGITQLNIGLGFESGIAIVILAIYLDRVTQAVGSATQLST